ncbi:uncharacterized protein LOC125520737 isoform X2 [Triticum urartu]|uniref:uncharacterized protein LOC125520737 isoform X2 n=1 Tax=Triticum urartu TaxID=4572 RepID=UPI002043EAC8|nr:uncharacterized protein LOC125520737 isoform X2 [Triticum urartu]
MVKNFEALISKFLGKFTSTVRLSCGSYGWYQLVLLVLISWPLTWLGKLPDEVLLRSLLVLLPCRQGVKQGVFTISESLLASYLPLR